jgi:hypothetical protein
MSINNAVFGMAVLCFAATASGSAVAADCGDPWVTQASTEILKRPPASASAPECNIYLYTGHNSAGQMEAGQWNGYGDLRAAVGAYWSTHDYPASAPLQLAIPPNAFNAAPAGFSGLPTGTITVYLYQGNWVRLVSAGGGNITTQLVSAGGGNLVSAGGGNLVSAGGGNLISQDGSTIVSAGGGNILLNGGANLSLYRATTGQ